MGSWQVLLDTVWNTRFEDLLIDDRFLLDGTTTCILWGAVAPAIVAFTTQNHAEYQTGHMGESRLRIRFPHLDMRSVCKGWGPWAYDHVCWALRKWKSRNIESRSVLPFVLPHLSRICTQTVRSPLKRLNKGNSGNNGNHIIGIWYEHIYERHEWPSTQICCPSCNLAKLKVGTRRATGHNSRDISGWRHAEQLLLGNWRVFKMTCDGLHVWTAKINCFVTFGSSNCTFVPIVWWWLWNICETSTAQEAWSINQVAASSRRFGLTMLTVSRCPRHRNVTCRTIGSVSHCLWWYFLYALGLRQGCYYQKDATSGAYFREYALVFGASRLAALHEILIQDQMTANKKTETHIYTRWTAPRYFTWTNFYTFKHLC